MLTNETAEREPRDALRSALHAAGPLDAGESAAFGQLVGSWRLHWTGFGDDGVVREALGELHVGWVLGGRAVQDVWIVPGRGRPGAGEPPHAFHGTTIRFFDRALGAWRSTWMDPVNGRVRTFVGRPDEDGITLISLDGDPLLRWRFTDITPDSFTWTGECSTDEARSWRLEERMTATRQAPGER